MVNVKMDDFGNKMVNDTRNITFKCPSCGEVEISRSRQARILSKDYSCSKCQFVGP